MKTVLKDLKLCTGCGACVANCSTHAIAMKPDEEGFLFPNIDGDACIHCGACERFCPVNPEYLKELLHGEPIAVYAAWNRDEEIRRQSSSGGVFTALAEQVLDEGGAVVGAAFDETFGVRHVMIETKVDLAMLRGSKYVQSEISQELYDRIRSELRKGRKILFSGTPCQVAGLRAFLRGRANGLFCCDIICHGTPSPTFWKKYVESKCAKNGKIVGVNLRSKKYGWERHFNVEYSYSSGRKENDRNDPYMFAFLRDYCLRESCYSCQFAATQRTGDITIADFWEVNKIHPEYNIDNLGTSLILVSTNTGSQLLEYSQHHLFTGNATLDSAILGNPMLQHPARRPNERNEFYKALLGMPLTRLFEAYKLSRPSIPVRLTRKIMRAVRKLFSINYKSKVIG